MRLRVRAGDRPGKPVDENVQHQFFTLRTVSEQDRCADRIGAVRRCVQGGIFTEAKEIKRPFAQAGFLGAAGCRCYGERLPGAVPAMGMIASSPGGSWMDTVPRTSCAFCRSKKKSW